MKVTIKAKPQDFIVEEIAKLPLVNKGAFGVYLLAKSGRNTVELLHELSRRLRIPAAAFSYGGRKDRHAQTCQYITIKSGRIPEIGEKSYSLKFIGFMRRPMSPDLIAANKFAVVVRRLSEKEAQGACAEIETVNRFGYPNYFDDQRFGSFDSRQGFLAQKVLKGEYNGALKIYLTSTNPDDTGKERERKHYIFEHWKDWEICSAHAAGVFEKEAFDFLKKYPTKFLEVLKRISPQELTSYISAYQAYLWNEMARRIVSLDSAGSYKKHEGAAGEYIFYAQLKDSSLSKLILSVPGPKAKIDNERYREIYEKVLEDNGIKSASFNKMKLRQAYFKSFPRQLIVRPQEVNFCVDSDEIYNDKKKLILKFTLGRGSFATMFIKRLFA